MILIQFKSKFLGFIEAPLGVFSIVSHLSVYEILTPAIDCHLLIQVPDRIEKDFCNKSASSAVEMTKTFKYLAARNLTQLKGSDLMMLYNLVSVLLIDQLSLVTQSNGYCTCLVYKMTLSNCISGVYQSTVPE